MKKSVSIQFILILVLSFSCVYGETSNDSWPTWRGPNMMGISPEGNPPTKWSETENIKWKVKLTGDGSDSSPVIWEDKIFFQSAVETDKKADGAAEPKEENQGGGGRPRAKKPTNFYKFNVVCLDRKTGKQLWETTVAEVLPHEGHHPDHGFASFSPVTDGKLILANFGSRGLYCLDMKGNIKWQKDLGKMNIKAGFGEGGSPNLAGENLIVVRDHEGDSFIYALNKKTGEIAWEKSRDEGTLWTSPIVADVNGQSQIIVNGSNRIRSYNAKNGDLIWECSGQTANAIPTPVLSSDMVFCTSGFRGSKLQAIKLGKTGDLTGTDAIAWELNEDTPYVPSPILYKDKLYVGSGNKNIISCYNAKTGKPYYVKQKLEEIKDVYASPAAAADRVYFVGRNGITYVIKNSDKLEVISVNKLDDGIDCSPAIAGNEIYLKGKKNLYCITQKQ